jgi:hypothetical protein
LRPGARQAEALTCRQGVAGARMMRLDTGGRLPRLVLTETGIVALRAMMSDRRLGRRRRTCEDSAPGRFSGVSIYACSPCGRFIRLTAIGPARSAIASDTMKVRAISRAWKVPPAPPATTDHHQE